ncbi:hypothetical protein [Hoyosella altamirensis]|uniref:Uncharacterized protein n=1 Tax=Hoyosella altamirensis TaxID=616997 RepID=A0A839RJ72_9ACTN|nr:hypothetical protein [Hoyosella altamirensis]MBB3036278.1 hypothetical protein [Hoyosella altamirensis]
MDYYTRSERIIANKHFQGSGNLEVTITKAWEDQTVLPLRDTGGATLEEQLPVLIHKLEIAEAEADWSRRQESRRSEIRKVRWGEVKQEASRSSPTSATPNNSATSWSGGKPPLRCARTQTRSQHALNCARAPRAKTLSGGLNGFALTPIKPIPSTGPYVYCVPHPLPTTSSHPT